MTLWDLTDKKTKENYEELLNADPDIVSFDIMPKEDVIEAIKKTMASPIDSMIFKEGLREGLGTIIIDPTTNKVVNGFVLYMPTHGGACKKCHEDIVCIYLPEGFKKVDPMDDYISVPFVEDIMFAMGRDLSVIDKQLTHNFGIMLPAQDYEFYCLSCGRWGKIVYDEETGLEFI